jgi:hypothetical protein
MKVDNQRAKTMRERLGEASELIESDQYLPLYRNRQMHYPDLFKFSIELAKKKDNPARYFATLWSSKNLAKSIDWLAKLVNLAKSKAAELIRDLKQRREDRKADAERKRNTANLDRLQNMRQGFMPGATPLRS